MGFIEVMMLFGARGRRESEKEEGDEEGFAILVARKHCPRYMVILNKYALSYTVLMQKRDYFLCLAGNKYVPTFSFI